MPGGAARNRIRICGAIDGFWLIDELVVTDEVVDVDELEL